MQNHAMDQIDQAITAANAGGVAMAIALGIVLTPFIG